MRVATTDGSLVRLGRLQDNSSISTNHSITSDVIKLMIPMMSPSEGLPFSRGTLYLYTTYLLISPSPDFFRFGGKRQDKAAQAPDWVGFMQVLEQACALSITAFASATKCQQVKPNATAHCTTRTCSAATPSHQSPRTHTYAGKVCLCPTGCSVARGTQPPQHPKTAPLALRRGFILFFTSPPPGMVLLSQADFPAIH